MELEYRIPNGCMVIHANVFFLEAGRRSIRKALKDYASSGVRAEETNRLVAWLTEKIRCEEESLKCLEDLHSEKARKLERFQAIYEYQKTFCGDKAHYRKAKEDLRMCMAEINGLSVDLNRIRKRMKRYRRSLEEVHQVLMIEGGSEA